MLQQIAGFGFFEQVQTIVAIAEVKITQHHIKRIPRQFCQGIARTGGKFDLVRAKRGKRHRDGALHVGYGINYQKQFGGVRIAVIMLLRLELLGVAAIDYRLKRGFM